MDKGGGGGAWRRRRRYGISISTLDGLVIGRCHWVGGGVASCRHGRRQYHAAWRGTVAFSHRRHRAPSKRDSAAVIIVDTTTDDATTPTRGCGRAHRLAAATAITTVLALLSRPAASATVAMDVSVLSTAASTQHATP